MDRPKRAIQDRERQHITPCELTAGSAAGLARATAAPEPLAASLQHAKQIDSTTADPLRGDVSLLRFGVAAVVGMVVIAVSGGLPCGIAFADFFSANLGRRRTNPSHRRQGTKMTIKRMDNVGFVVDDLDAAVEFFTELGLELSPFLAPPMVADHRSAPVNSLGYVRVMFAEEDIDDTLARLGERCAEGDDTV